MVVVVFLEIEGSYGNYSHNGVLFLKFNENVFTLLFF